MVTVVLSTIDKYDLIHLKIKSIREFISDFEMIKYWLNEIEKQTDNNFVMIKQNKKILTFCVYDIEKITHKMTGELRENFILSAVGYDLGNDTEKKLFSKSL